MMLRNMAASYLWHRSSVQSVGGWSQGTAVPALVARLQAAPQPPEARLLHILRALVNFAATGINQSDATLPVALYGPPFGDPASPMTQFYHSLPTSALRSVLVVSLLVAAGLLQQRGCDCGQ